MLVFNFLGTQTWGGEGMFEPKDVHHQVAITFTTPKYLRSIHSSDHVHVSNNFQTSF